MILVYSSHFRWMMSLKLMVCPAVFTIRGGWLAKYQALRHESAHPLTASNWEKRVLLVPAAPVTTDSSGAGSLSFRHAWIPLPIRGFILFYFLFYFIFINPRNLTLQRLNQICWNPKMNIPFIHVYAILFLRSEMFHFIFSCRISIL